MRWIWFFLVSSSALATIEKRCATEAFAPEAQRLLVSLNNEAPAAMVALNEMAGKKEMRVIALKSGEVGFQSQAIKAGDCFLGKVDETTNWTVEGKKRALTPVVFFRKDDGAKLFAFLDDKTWLGLSLQKHTETSVGELLGYASKRGGLVVLYVICPPKRDGACELTIKNNGKWVVENGKKFSLPVYARASREPAKETQSLRLHVGGDTPQGIYYVWASMYTNKGFGGEPRIDLEAAMPPVNAAPYSVNSYVLSELVPEKSWDDYWVNEWPLAYKLGRTFLRVHGRSNGTIETEGCINSGAGTRRLLNKLESLGVFSQEAIAKIPPKDAATLGWKVSPRLGKTFLIVKDRDK